MTQRKVYRSEYELFQEQVEVAQVSLGRNLYPVRCTSLIELLENGYVSNDNEAASLRDIEGR